MSLESRYLFFKKLLHQPGVNASITPSSRFLASAMVEDIDFSSIKNIIEFGPGTGVFTKAIIEKCNVATKIICIEYEAEYVDLLHKTFDDRIIVEKGDVSSILAILEKYNIDTPDLIISGLPFHVYTPTLMETLDGYISGGTIFRGFSYTPHQFRAIYKKLPLVQKSFVVRNFPPAFVFGAN